LRLDLMFEQPPQQMVEISSDGKRGVLDQLALFDMGRRVLSGWHSRR
jgi:hypothetical protein